MSASSRRAQQDGARCRRRGRIPVWPCSVAGLHEASHRRSRPAGRRTIDPAHNDYDPLAQPPAADGARPEIVVWLGGGVRTALLLAAGHQQTRLAALDATLAATAAVSRTTALGVTAHPMGVGQPAAIAGLELSLRRIMLTPGGWIPGHSHPGALVIFVQSGTWGYTALGGTAQLSRAAVDGALTPAEPMPIGSAVLLAARD